MSAPVEGTKGLGVGDLMPPEILRENEDPFHSIVWFPYSERAAAEEFAAQFGYVVREGVPL
jgi:hypothetical protein